MSQEWKTNSLLVDMHGNNGSIDNDPAAAMRYTEVRLSPFAEALLKDIDKKTVTFVPNFDDCELEPTVLPAKFPNLLVNGAQGMATGYATNIPPHNLSEVLEATIYRTKHPESNIDDLLAFIKGPDFPTGGIVEGENGIRQAFTTGKGKIILKAKVIVKDTELIIEEIPFEVNKADLVRKIDDIRLKKKIDGILDVKDMSDRKGLSILITLKKDIPSDIILAYLYKNTDLKISYNYNIVAICQRSPKQLGLVQIIDEFIQHQKEVIRNKSNFELRKAEKRKHIFLGFLNMVEVLDEVILTIRSSNGKKDAINKIIDKFHFTIVQADAIVSLQLYRLSNTDVKEMRKETTELTKKIKKYNLILSNERVLENVIISELQEFHDKYYVERKTQIFKEIQEIKIDEHELIQNEEVRFILSRDGYIKHSSLKSYQATQGSTGLKENDLVLKQCTLNTRDNLIFFTNLGKFILLPVYKSPDLKWRDTGEYISNFAHLEPGERVIDFIIVNNFNSDANVLLANQEGQIKQVRLSDFQKTRINKTYKCMNASKINQLVSVDLLSSYDLDVVLASSNGYLLKYEIAEIPIQALTAKGVKGINLREDTLIGAKYVSRINKDEILLLTNRGGLIREFTQNINISHRPSRGKPRLKSVKSNPYKFIGMISTNIFRLKELLTIRILGEKDETVIRGVDLQPDRYEYGISVLSKNKKPMYISYDLDDIFGSNQILEKLYVDINEDKLPLVEEKVDSDVMYELEKILSSKNNANEFKGNYKKDEEDEDLDEDLIQQTLF